MLRKLFARFLASGYVFVLGPSDGRLGRWYDENGHFKYPVGRRIRVVSRSIVGFGVDARGTVIGYEKDDESADRYVIDMDTCRYVLFNGWFNGDWVPGDAPRTVERESHFKWNIEHHFVPE